VTDFHSESELPAENRFTLFLNPLVSSGALSGAARCRRHAVGGLMENQDGLGLNGLEAQGTILQPGRNCWRLEAADRLALLLDSAEYFAALKAALLRARRSIWILAWTFDPLTRLSPDVVTKSRDPEHADRLGLVLRRLTALNPGLDVRILAWDMPPPIAASLLFAPQRGQAFFADSPVKFRLDNSVPMSASQHQKAVIIDGRIVFISGGDMGPDRWDTCHHADHDPRRRLPNGRRYPARHEVSMLVEGHAALAMADHFAERWRVATNEPLSAFPPEAESPWPPEVRADLTHQKLAIARTVAPWKGRPGAFENLRLHLDAIAEARDLIFLENQYLTSPLVVEALAMRLLEPNGPEIVTVGPAESPSYFDQLTMDSARVAAIERLRQVDPGGRFHAFTPHTPGGGPVIVHSKVSIIDDRLLRIGSANLNNRSTGLDSELDVAFEAQPGEAGAVCRTAIAAFRNRLIGHYMERSAAEVAAAEAEAGSLGAGVRKLDTTIPARLPFAECKEPGPFARFVAKWHLGDPTTPQDAWNPWNRRKRLRDDLARLVLEDEADDSHASQLALGAKA
jgi:phosphatidylserine/phosphatidylglycerophosphate/cardiolipin synthase-like enzyme